MFSGVIPEPINVGIDTALLTASTSLTSAGWPVDTPDTITPLAWKNSAALAVSTMSTSAVMACAECFFLISAKTRTFSAPIGRRYRKSDPAVDSIRPSSATWARTTLPACGTYRSSEPTARTLSHQRSILSRHCGSSVKNPFRRGASRELLPSTLLPPYVQKREQVCSYSCLCPKRGP